MSEQIKPCPWCGNKAMLRYIDGEKKLWYIRCSSTSKNCPVIPCTWVTDSEEEAIKDWNTRLGENK